MDASLKNAHGLIFRFSTPLSAHFSRSVVQCQLLIKIGRDLPSSGTANCQKRRHPKFSQNTIIGHLSSAAVATLLGLVTCLALRGMGRRRRSVLMGIANIPLLNADIVTGISLMLLFLGLGLRLGYGTILMAHIVFNLPYVILCLMPQMLSLDRNCYDAARDLGATPFMAFRRVVLPELRPSLLAGFMLAFTMSADDFIITHFTKGAGIDTLPTEIYAELKLGIHPEMYALSTLVFVFVLVFAFLLFWNRKRMQMGQSAH